MSTSGIAIIGSGPTALYCLKHILVMRNSILKRYKNISIFESGKKMGVGMPYNEDTTDIFNLSNISSEEIPELTQTLAEWLRLQTKDELSRLNITDFPIEKSKVYSRLALGAYFHSQYKVLIHRLKEAGFNIEEFTQSKVTDIIEENKNTITVVANNTSTHFSKVYIATGHHWNQEKDTPDSGYFASPWPIKKILPPTHHFYNFEIGILGASLSAFDVVSSLAHRHGQFIKNNDSLEFKLNPEAKGLKFILHSLEGWLPHLQYEQEEPFREIYRHTNREQLLALKNEKGFLHIDTFFEVVCKPALIVAFKKDKNEKLTQLLPEASFGFKEFIDEMAKNHTYIDSFKGMKTEMTTAKKSVENDKPIHWMETLDDLIYCLNFHAELMPAEDHLFFNKEVKPFLMSVIAALPLDSAEILLALYNANVIDLVKGRVDIIEESQTQKSTRIKITSDTTSVKTKSYKLFINCSGNDNVDLEHFPFKSLVSSGTVSKAKAPFEFANSLSDVDQPLDDNQVLSTKEGFFLYTGGIEIDSAFRLVSNTKNVEPNIYDLSFTHTFGCRPYSYGLQACNATSCIAIHTLLDTDTKTTTIVTPEIVSKLYEKHDKL